MQLQILFPEGRYGYDNKYFLVPVNGTDTVVATKSGTTWTLTTYGAALKATNIADLADDLSTGLGATEVATASAVETSFGDGCHRTVITLTALAQTITNSTAEYAGTKIYTFPVGRILFLGSTISFQQTTTSATATTIASEATGAFALGRATASSTSLTGQMVDLCPSTAYTASTTINVAATTAKAALAVSAQFDGTGTAIPVFFNTAIATGSADGTQTITGTVTISWINLGDY